MILTNGYSFESAKLLRDTIEKLTGKRMLVTSNPDRIKKLDIRYGNSSPVNCNDPGLNPPEFIRLLSDKLKFSNLLLANNFHTPKFEQALVPEEYPILVRESLHLSGGRGIHLVKGMDELNAVWNFDYYWTKFVHTQFEIRAHVVGKKVVRIFRKESELENEEEYPIRNNKRGYHFSLRNIDAYKKVIELVDKLFEIPELSVGHFCALDLGWDSNKNQYFIFEGNTAPGLNENTCEFYAKYLCEQLQLPLLEE